MKRLLFVLTFMSLTFPVIWGQTKIQKYAGTAMPYPNRTDSSITFRDGMTPVYPDYLTVNGENCQSWARRNKKELPDV